MHHDKKATVGHLAPVPDDQKTSIIFYDAISNFTFYRLTIAPKDETYFSAQVMEEL